MALKENQKKIADKLEKVIWGPFEIDVDVRLKNCSLSATEFSRLAHTNISFWSLKPGKKDRYGSTEFGLLHNSLYKKNKTKQNLCLGERQDKIIFGDVILEVICGVDWGEDLELKKN